MESLSKKQVEDFHDQGYVIIHGVLCDEEIDRTPLLEPTRRTRGGASGRWNDRTVLWAHPAFANQHVVVRNDREIIRVSLAATDY